MLPTAVACDADSVHSTELPGTRFTLRRISPAHSASLTSRRLPDRFPGPLDSFTAARSLPDVSPAVPSRARWASSSRSSSVRGTEPRSDVSIGVTKLSPSMGFPCSPQHLCRGAVLLQGSPNLARPRERARHLTPRQPGGRRASCRPRYPGSPPGSLACFLSPALHPSHRFAPPTEVSLAPVAVCLAVRLPPHRSEQADLHGVFDVKERVDFRP